jgi:diacylglycerol kinase family enzyme
MAMDYKNALEVINKGEVIKIDTFKVNDEVCIGTFGIGFDGHVAHLFAHSPKRGYSTYAKIVLREFYKYKPIKYEMKINGEPISKECFLLTFANSSQFGNNAAIAPFADIRDGELDITMISKFPLITTPRLIYRLMHAAIHKSKFVTLKKAKEVVLKNNTPLRAHIDGEPVTFSSDLHIKIVPLSLNVIVPQQ